MNGQIREIWQNWHTLQEKSMALWKDAFSTEPPLKDAKQFSEPMKDVWEAFWKSQETLLNLWKENSQVFSQGAERSEAFKDLWQGWWKYQESMLEVYKALPPQEQLQKMIETLESLEYLERTKQLYSDWLKLLTAGVDKYNHCIPGGVNREVMEMTMSGVNEMFRGWLEVMDNYTSMTEKGLVEFSKESLSSPAFSELRQKLLDAFFILWDHSMRYKEEFFKHTGLASQEDIARLGRMLINLEEKTDQVVNHLDRITESANYEASH
ncbi:MAG: hypothetical protein HPY50_20875 [Firmicutes bacterium]|nr:hypothetical protein [Bacillota bacterium]